MIIFTGLLKRLPPNDRWPWAETHFGQAPSLDEEEIRAALAQRQQQQQQQRRPQPERRPAGGRGPRLRRQSSRSRATEELVFGRSAGGVCDTRSSAFAVRETIPDFEASVACGQGERGRAARGLKRKRPGFRKRGASSGRWRRYTMSSVKADGRTRQQLRERKICPHGKLSKADVAEAPSMIPAEPAVRGELGGF